MEPYYRPDRHVFLHWTECEAVRDADKQIPYLPSEVGEDFDGWDKREECEILGTVDEECNY